MPSGHVDGGDPDALDDASAPKGFDPEQLNGDYLFVVSLSVAPKVPAVFLSQIQAERVGDRLRLSMRQLPLSKLDRATQVGLWSKWNEGELLDDGSFRSEPIKAYIPAEANPITTFDTEAEIALESHFIDNAQALQTSREPIDFLCGNVLGQVLSPIPIDDLTGSTFTATRIVDIDDPASYPEIVINCNREPARPLQ